MISTLETFKKITDKCAIKNADSTEVMHCIPEKSIDLTLTSPPYDSLRTYKSTQVWNFEIFSDIAKQLYRVTKDGGTVVWIVNDQTKNGSESGSSFRQALEFVRIGFNLHDTMIWQKDSSPYPEQTRYYQIFEYMFILTKGKISTFNQIKDRKNIYGLKKEVKSNDVDKRGEMKQRKRIPFMVQEMGSRYNIWNITNSRNERIGDGKIKHPAIFPIKLASDHIISWTNQDDIVFDPMMGSATTGASAIRHNRQFIGIEKVGEYYREAEQRLQIEASKLL